MQFRHFLMILTQDFPRYRRRTGERERDRERERCFFERRCFLVVRPRLKYFLRVAEALGIFEKIKRVAWSEASTLSELRAEPRFDLLELGPIGGRRSDGS